MNKYIKKLIKCHNHLIQSTKSLSDDLIVKDYGGQALKTLDTCLSILHGSETYSDKDNHISDEKIVSYCINNVYRMSKMRGSVIDFFKIAQIFGKTSVEKYLSSKTGSRYYENQFLSSINVTRNDLVMLIVDRDRHPHSDYIYPVYEERTKKRALNTDAGLYLCKRSTLLWAPMSPTCKKCMFAEVCKQALLNKYPELYRLRTEQ